MNSAGAKGRKGEEEVVDVFVAAGFPRADPEDPEDPGVKRFRGGFESHDVQGVGSWVIEAKFRKAWHVFGWVRKIRRRSDGRPWAIVAIHGDRRTIEGREVGRVMILDADMGAMLIRHWEGADE